MGALSWLNPLAYRKKAAPTDYETVLSRLSTEIAEAKQHLSEIRLRQRRASLLLNLYGIILWLIWCGLWYFQKLPWGLVGLYADDIAAQAAGLAVVVLGPIGLLGLNRVNGLFFARQRTREETNLRNLLKTQHDKIEEIKKATNYYSTRDLLEKYDELSRSSPSGNSSRGSPGTPTPASRRGQPGKTGLQNPAANRLATLGAVSPAQNGMSPIPAQAQAQMQMLQQQSMSSSMQPVLPTPTKKWYDHVADRLLGDDPSQASQTKYALVCGGCFRHNGLVGDKAEWENMKWICPRCSYFNPSPKSRRASADPSVPSTPTAPMNPTATREMGTSEGETRRRKGKTTASSGLKNEVEKDEEGDVSNDRMEVDEEPEEGTL
ncbi:hypothetical protein NliqN6_3405 [Naganishia liquefaciens]|uniref:Endoplasmic reticulum junction formation protein lunapark n=1 Tax=Naganishia liquefaciens TaxID=104408 RepID=A0A8H3TU93_9TREE|nr:hypothetical protein NliqN6_3405 [Naganishia liquefaciens]